MMRWHDSWLMVVATLAVSASAWADLWSAPAGYYDAATGTGAALESQLVVIMSAGQIQRTYGDFRYAAAITDADPNRPGNLLTVYDRRSVPAAWDAGNTWNREHVWPQSLQPGTASNSSRGNLGDPHALRPAGPGINTSRGNKPFGFADTTGSYRAVAGGFYFPGDADKGDIARQLFYSDTLYGNALGINLVRGDPGPNQMGDLAALLAWHRDDPPDDFERRRNHTISSQAENPNHYTNNRNAYIDDPEFAFQVFGLAGDATLDFLINQVDLDAVLDNWGEVGGWTAGDFNRSRTIEQGDLDAVLNGWGSNAVASFDGVSVPEPVAIWFLLVGGIGVNRRRLQHAM